MNIEKEKKEEMSVKRSILMLMVILLIPAVMASASMTGPLQVQVKYGDSTATWSCMWDNASSSYKLADPVNLTIAGQTVATLTDLTCTKVSDPTLILDFSIHAFVPISVTFDTGLLTFPTITNPTAFATAGVSLTGDSDGGTASGNFAGGRLYEATYNGGTVFADLLPTISVGPNNTVTESDRFPASGFATIAGDVSSMRAQFSFNLTEGESLAGTSRYEIAPIPDANTLALIFSGGIPTLAVFAIRRRKYV